MSLGKESRRKVSEINLERSKGNQYQTLNRYVSFISYFWGLNLFLYFICIYIHNYPQITQVPYLPLHNVGQNLHVQWQCGFDMEQRWVHVRPTVQDTSWMSARTIFRFILYFTTHIAGSSNCTCSQTVHFETQGDHRKFWMSARNIWLYFCILYTSQSAGLKSAKRKKSKTNRKASRWCSNYEIPHLSHRSCCTYMYVKYKKKSNSSRRHLKYEIGWPPFESLQPLPFSQF